MLTNIVVDNTLKTFHGQLDLKPAINKALEEARMLFPGIKFTVGVEIDPDTLTFMIDVYPAEGGTLQ